MKLMTAIPMMRVISANPAAELGPIGRNLGFVAAAMAAGLAIWTAAQADAISASWNRFAAAATARPDYQSFADVPSEWQWSAPVVRFDEMYGASDRADRLDWIRESGR